MERCPTCKAKYSGKRICHRCKADLGSLLDIEEQAKEHLQKAKEAYASDDLEGLIFHARRSCSLRRTPEAARLLGCATLLSNRYDSALEQWRAVRGKRPEIFAGFRRGRA